jgi:hypothetical protein
MVEEKKQLRNILFVSDGFMFKALYCELLFSMAVGMSSRYCHLGRLMSDRNLAYSFLNPSNESNVPLKFQVEIACA